VIEAHRTQGPLFFCHTGLNVYLDESGDLGWSFDKPYEDKGWKVLFSGRSFLHSAG
jgi:hypothetical protein